MAVPTALFLASAVTFTALAGLFTLGYIFSFADKARRAAFFSSAAMVAIVTAATNWILYSHELSGTDVGTIARAGDAVVVYWIQWASNAICFYFVGQSLTTALFEKDVHIEAGAAGLRLGLLGTGFLLVQFVPTAGSALQWGLLIGLFLLFMHFVACVFKIGESRDRQPQFGWLIGFVIVIILIGYGVPYVVGSSFLATVLVTDTIQQWWYFFADILLKVGTPLIQVMWFQSTSIAYSPSAAPLLPTSTTSMPLASGGRSRTKFF